MCFFLFDSVILTFWALCFLFIFFGFELSPIKAKQNKTKISNKRDSKNKKEKELNNKNRKSIKSNLLKPLTLRLLVGFDVYRV